MEIFQNRILVIALLTNIFVQIIKVFTYLIAEKRFNIKRAFETGGMPSSHAAIVVALTTGVAVEYGLASPYFSISLILALIVMFDAIGIRKSAGEQAKVLNSIVVDLQRFFISGFQQKELKTLLGHTKLQVFVGSIIGFFVPYIIMNYIWIVVPTL